MLELTEAKLEELLGQAIDEALAPVLADLEAARGRIVTAKREVELWKAVASAGLGLAALTGLAWGISSIVQ